MSKITIMNHVGLFTSLLPDSPLKTLIFKDHCHPRYIRGVSPNKLHDNITFDFRFVSSSREYVTLKVVWKLPPHNTLTYHMSRGQGRSGSSRNRLMNDEAWLIEARMMLQNDRWGYSGRSLSATDKNIVHNFDKLRERFEQTDDSQLL